MIFTHLGAIPEVTQRLSAEYSAGMTTLGMTGMLMLFMRAYSLGGGTYTGIEAVSNGLQQKTDADVQKYVDLTRRLGFAAEGVTDIGTEVVEEATHVCERVAKQYPKATIISGKLVFRQERMFNRLLHNETPTLIQRRLQWLGVPMVVLPVRADV
jgi:hypothetical protein